jgi:two-component system sensor histidine kinase SenX3
MVRGDENLLSIATENLMHNALKFRRRPEAVIVEVKSGASRVTLSVTSPGARISSTERERVFDRFYRGAEARGATEGHGLGLPLCRHIARLHGGEARCVSGEEEDARFVLELPSWKPMPVVE